MQKPARVRILDAAHELMLTIGLARATTKEIAKAAGCSEAALYKYFASKEDLFVTVLKERLPRLNPLLSRLAEDPGERSVEENLTEIARQAALFYEQSFPIAASLYAEPKLKRRHDAAMREMGSGPAHAHPGPRRLPPRRAGRRPYQPRSRHLRRGVPAARRLCPARLRVRHDRGRETPAVRRRVRRLPRPHPPARNRLAGVSQSSIPACSFAFTSSGAADPRTDCLASSASSSSVKP